MPSDREAETDLLSQWTAQHALDGHGRSAVVVGSGLGADADVSPTGVASARERHPESRVDYLTADLLDLPAEWVGGFDFVFESLTVQSLPVDLHDRAIRSVCSLVAPGGTLLVVAASRLEGSAVDGPPWPLTKTEIEAFAADELHMYQVEDLVDEHDPDVRRWRVELHRSG